MNDDYKTTFVEPAQTVAVADVGEAPSEELAAKAFEDIRSTERLSGFGSFVTKLQSLFQASKPRQAKQGSSHLKLAPIMMSAGLLLLFATGLLFLLSKPESAVPSHFRQPAGLVGDDHFNAAPNIAAEPQITEDQLAGQDASAVGGMASSTSKKNAVQSAPSHRFSFAGDNPSAANAATQPVAQGAANTLATPATVFVDDPAAGTSLKPDITATTSHPTGPQLPVGTEIAAHTTNAISSGLESPVVAVVDRSVRLGDAIVIPEGARVIGQTAGSVKDRVNVRFTSIVLPNEQQMAISGLALMKDGSAGLMGKVIGKHNPVLGTAARIGTGAAVVATEFAGQGSLDQPFSQADYLRNQMAAEVASQGNQFSNRLQQPISMPIVAVNANQSITIFLLEPLTISGKTIRGVPAAWQLPQAAISPTQNPSSDHELIEAQTAYIQALEAQLDEMKSAGGKTPNDHQ